LQSISRNKSNQALTSVSSDFQNFPLIVPILYQATDGAKELTSTSPATTPVPAVAGKSYATSRRLLSLFLAIENLTENSYGMESLLTSKRRSVFFLSGTVSRDGYFLRD
jgi:hypothetical protein